MARRLFLASSEAEIEEYRLQDKQRVLEKWKSPDETIEQTVKGWDERFNNAIGFTEVRDRLHIVNENLYDYVMGHPLVVQNPDLYQQLWLAHERLAHVYQMVSDVEEQVCNPPVVEVTFPFEVSGPCDGSG